MAKEVYKLLSESLGGLQEKIGLARDLDFVKSFDFQGEDLRGELCDEVRVYAVVSRLVAEIREKFEEDGLPQEFKRILEDFDLADANRLKYLAFALSRQANRLEMAFLSPEVVAELESEIEALVVEFDTKMEAFSALVADAPRDDDGRYIFSDDEREEEALTLFGDVEELNAKGVEMSKGLDLNFEVQELLEVTRRDLQSVEAVVGKWEEIDEEEDEEIEEEVVAVEPVEEETELADVYSLEPSEEEVADANEKLLERVRSRKFKLLSGLLEDVRSVGDMLEGDRRMMRFDTAIIDSDGALRDEREVFLVAADIFEAFHAAPGEELSPELRDLMRYYSLASGYEEEYLVFALNDQQKRLQAVVLSNEEVDKLYKKLKEIRAKIEKKQAELDDLLRDPVAYCDDLTDKRFSRRHSSRRSRLEGYNYGNAKENVLERVRAEFVDLVNKLNRQIEVMRLEGRLILEKINENKEADELLASTVKDLDMIKARMVDGLVAESSIVTRRNLHLYFRNGDSKGKNVDAFEKLIAGDNHSAEAKIAVGQLRDFVKIAQQYGKVRILSAKELDFMSAWERVFESLGCDVRLQEVGYEQLRGTSDLETPLLVPGGMNTHHDLWDRRKFTNACVIQTSPNQLANILAEVGEEGL